MLEYRDFVISLFLKLILISCVHEFAHLFTLILLGGQGHIMASWEALYTVPTLTVPYFSMIIVAYAGGLLSALLCLFLWYFEEDDEDRIIWRVFGWVQFAYGLVEGTTYMNDWLWKYNTIFFIIAMTISIAWSLLTSKKLISKLSMGE